MTIDSEQWCCDLISSLQIRTTVKVVSKKYDGDFLHCKLIIDDGFTPFVVSFIITNRGCVLSPLVQPELIYGFDNLNDDDKYSLLRLEYRYSSYLSRHIDLKPSIKDFRIAIMVIRSLWLGDDEFIEFLQRTQKQKS